VPPTAVEHLLPTETIDRSGPYYISVKVNDNIAVDTNNVKVHYFAPGIAEDSILISHEIADIWSGYFQFDTYLQDGDSVMYYFSFNDLATPPHRSRFPETNYFTFKITQIAEIDDFEYGLNKWNNESDVWQIFTNPELVKSGNSCLISGNGLTYPPDSHTIISLKHPINLQTRNAVTIQFYETNMLEQNTDSAFFEIREGDGEWVTLKTFARIWSNWKPYSFDLTSYCGINHDPISIRFRFKSDSNTHESSRFGIKIDKLEILVDAEVSIDDNKILPDKFKLFPPFPNPFNSIVAIPYVIPNAGQVDIRIFDLLGREIYHLTEFYPKSGYNNLRWQGKAKAGEIVPSGIYFVQLQYNDKVETQKILLLK
ncbi:T9SS type A sorting domain-containing protein, partial [Candidatus Pacearchaeota archaeon]|nr:T9SS type A sorting domain-containing protein [Candidatus Pacearchaeota archaeon]